MAAGFSDCFPRGVTFPSGSLLPTEGVGYHRLLFWHWLVGRTALASAGVHSAQAVAVMLRTLPAAHSPPGTDSLSVYPGAFKVPFCSVPPSQRDPSVRQAGFVLAAGFPEAHVWI